MLYEIRDGSNGMAHLIWAYRAS